MTTLKPYSGRERKLVLSIDVGTTFSGMSYAVLDPGEEPKIETVKRYPGKANVPQDYRIPSILNYRPDGTVHSCGAEAESEDTRMELEYEDLVLAKWFKLHLRPDHLDNEEVNKKNIPPLPDGKTVVQVFADFLRYLVSCASSDISQSHAAIGESRWDSFKDHIEFVLTHPNGWEGPQQSKMREAAILAGLVPDTPAGRDRIRFVAEGEAGLHYCLQKASLGDSMKSGERIMVVDAGGGTVDLSSYVFNSTSPLSVDELSAPDCIIQGSTVVNMRAERLIRERLANCPDVDGEIIRTMMEDFEKKTKPLFSNQSTRGRYVCTGLNKLNAPTLNIRKGNMLLTFDEMRSFFHPSLDVIVDSVRKQFQSTQGRPISSVFLIGGFSANEWLYDNLKAQLDNMGLRLYRPEEHMSKAVSEGAIGHYLEHYVSSRIAKATYGTPVNTRFNPFDPEHRQRIDLADLSFSGIVFDDGFSVLVKKGSPVTDGAEFSEEFGITYHKSREVKEITDEILKYTGKEKNPRWRSTEPENYKRLCLVRADVSNLEGAPFRGLVNDVYIKRFKLVLRFGAEIQAHISWLENGEEKQGPAQLVYDDDDSR